MCINYQIDFKLIQSIILRLNGQKQMPSRKDTSTAFFAEWLLANLVACQLHFSTGPTVGQYTQHYRGEIGEHDKIIESMVALGQMQGSNACLLCQFLVMKFMSLWLWP